MTILRVLFFVILAVRGLDCVRPDIPWGSPMSFVYKDKYALNIDIFLKNVPPKTTHYIVYVQVENCDFNVKTEQYKQQGSSCYEPAINGTIQTNETIRISSELNKPSVMYFIELRNSNNTCSTKQIMEGVRDEHADVADNVFHKTCINNYDRPCRIIVDFENKCEDKINCTQSLGRLTCESTNEEYPEDTIHQWYQCYSDDSFIGTIPPMRGKKTKFEMSFQKFDLYTNVYSKIDSMQRKKDLYTEVFKIAFPTNGYNEYHISHSKTYSELEPVLFICPKNAHTQIGWIDPTGYVITTYDVTSYSRSFIKKDNNSMLCCLHYNTYYGIVERSVDDITVLIYKGPEKQKNVNASIPHTDNISLNTRQTQVIRPEPEAPQSTALAEEPQDQQHIESADKTKYYIGIASLAGSIILISLIYVVIKKRYRKSSDPGQTLQLETYASTNAVLYAELDIQPGDAPPPHCAEDPTYAIIIGEIRPQNQNDKK